MENWTNVFADLRRDGFGTGPTAVQAQRVLDVGEQEGFEAQRVLHFILPRVEAVAHEAAKHGFLSFARPLVAHSHGTADSQSERLTGLRFILGKGPGLSDRAVLTIYCNPSKAFEVVIRKDDGESWEKRFSMKDMTADLVDSLIERLVAAGIKRTPLTETA